MLVVKFAVVEAGLGLAALFASTNLDGTAERIVLWGAAGAAILWFYANVLRPVAKIIRKTADAVEHLGQLPQIGRKTDVLAGAALENRSAIRAMCREFGIDFRKIARKDDPDSVADLAELQGDGIDRRYPDI